MIVDAQVHLWDASTPGRADDQDLVKRPHLPEPLTWARFLAMMDEAGVNAAFIMPPPWCGANMDHALEAATVHPRRFAVVPSMDFATHSGNDLRRWRNDFRVKALRTIFTGPKGVLLENDSIDWFWRATSEAALPVMVLAPGRLDRIGAIAAKFPDLQIVIDHMGLTLQIARSGGVDVAIETAAALAQHKNISMKLTSVATYSTETYPFSDMTRFLSRLVGAFGAARCFWGADITMAFDKCSYKLRVAHFAEALTALSSAELDLIMGRALVSLARWEI